MTVRTARIVEPTGDDMRFASFAERTNSLKGCLPKPALQGVAKIHAATDPDAVLVAPHMPG